MEIKKKIKVLIAPSDHFGTGSYRCIWPAQEIERIYGEDFEMEINLNINPNDIDYLKQFDIIHFHRHLGKDDSYIDVLPKLKSLPNPPILVLDIDDYFIPPAKHPIAQMIIKNNLTEKLIKTIEISDYVTTTTEIFADEIKKLNKNVFVLPNAINPMEPMWASSPVENVSGKCRILFAGGSSHKSDLELLNHSMTLLHRDPELKDKFQIILCGFDTRGTVTAISPDGTEHTRKINSNETVWLDFEKTMNNNNCGEKEDPEYFKWLSKISKDDYPDMYKKNYVRRWTLPLTRYAEHYDYCDISLAPLCDVDYRTSPKGQITKEVNHFNRNKSELKIIEAGFKKKALILSNFGIYNKLIENGKTGLLVDEKDNDKGWYKAMKTLILNPKLRQELSENLYNYVKDKYNITTAAKTRTDFYKNIMNKRKQ